MTTENDPTCVEVGDEPRPTDSHPQNRHLPRGEVHVFDNWCKGCGLCIEFCPQGVLVLGLDNRPKPIYPENCTACRWCELHCPDFAIFITASGTEDESALEEDHAPSEAVKAEAP